MPIYEYECDSCGEEHELIQNISAKPLRKCPACGRLKLRRKISRSAFHLKGEGWYVTDYAKNEDKKSDNGNGESKSDSSVKTETKAESKSSEPKSNGTKSSDSKAGGEKKKEKSKAKSTD